MTDKSNSEWLKILGNTKPKKKVKILERAILHFTSSPDTYFELKKSIELYQKMCTQIYEYLWDIDTWNSYVKEKGFFPDYFFNSLPFDSELEKIRCELFLKLYEKKYIKS